MREWWNGRHTVLRGRRAQPIRVQIPSRAPESCERIRLKTLSHSKSRRMHMAPIGANMAPWYNGYYIGLSLRRSGFDSPWSRHRHHRRNKCMVAVQVRQNPISAVKLPRQSGRYEVLIWASSSAGRAPALQAGGSAFESRLVHHLGLFSVSCPFNSESA